MWEERERYGKVIGDWVNAYQWLPLSTIYILINTDYPYPNAFLAFDDTVIIYRLNIVIQWKAQGTLIHYLLPIPTVTAAVTPPMTSLSFHLYEGHPKSDYWHHRSSWKLCATGSYLSV
jgi:hypothetical protein